MRRKRLYLVGVNGRYGENVYLPYAVGLLWAYAQRFPDITAAYEMCGFLYLKEQVPDAVAKITDPDVIAFSHYIWNAEWNRALARCVKEKWPACQVVVGGVQVHDDSPQTIEEESSFDFAIFGEGEGAFVDFLREHSKEEPDYSTCGSLVYRDRDYVRVNRRREFTDLANLRSPYLDGVFANMLQHEKKWTVLQETVRGCPYLCSFCAWGQASLNKLRSFPFKRLHDELEWFGQQQVDYLENADANMGILPRDIDLTNALLSVKKKYGYPKTFRASFAKNSNDMVWEIANLLNKEKMLKSVTLAMQSMEDNVLVNIKRKNIKFSKFGDLIKRYESAGIPTYTELILGLPGETVETFLDGIEKNLAAGQHSGLFVYTNLMLNNTEQNTPEYIAIHKLRSLSMQAMLSHGTPDSSTVREKQSVVVETSTMPHAEWKRAWLFSKVIEVFHAQGLLQHTAITLHEKHKTKYIDFYASLEKWLKSSPDTVAGQQFTMLRDVLGRALGGGSWDCVDARFGDVSWPPEEFAFARICCELDRFYSEIAQFFQSLPDADSLLAVQRKQIDGPAIGAEAAWARDVVWYGRRGAGALKKRSM